MSFARVPPGGGTMLLPAIWDRHFPGYRERLAAEGPFIPVHDDKLAAKVDGFSNGAPLPPDEIDFDASDADSLVIERSVSKRRGTWWQLPKDLETGEDSE